MRITKLIAGMLLSGTVSTASAQPAAPDVSSLVTPAVMDEIRAWAGNDVVLVTIAAQNLRRANLDQQAIDALDQQWRDEREREDQPLIAATLSNPLSTYLSRIQGRSTGLYSEIFVMDKNGLNAGQSSITSDYWQGDEAKFQKTYDVGPDAIFIDEPEWDDDTRIWRVQVNFTVADHDASKVGAITVELNLTELQRRQGA